MLVLNHFYCFDSVSVNCEQWTLCAHIVVSRWINSSSGSFERESHSRSHVSSMQYALNIAIANEQTRPSELFMRHLIAALIVLAHGAQNTFIEMRERFCKRWNSRMKRFWYWSSLSLCGCVCVCTKRYSAGAQFINSFYLIKVNWISLRLLSSSSSSRSLASSSSS